MALEQQAKLQERRVRRVIDPILRAMEEIGAGNFTKAQKDAAERYLALGEAQLDAARKAEERNSAIAWIGPEMKFTCPPDVAAFCKPFDYAALKQEYAEHAKQLHQYTMDGMKLREQVWRDLAVPQHVVSGFFTVDLSSSVDARSTTGGRLVEESADSLARALKLIESVPASEPSCK